MERPFFTPALPIILRHYPDAQAVYLFGSALEDPEHAEDVDIAILLHPAAAKRAGSFALSDLRQELEALFRKPVDLVNLRAVSVVFRKEIVFTGERMHTGDEFAAYEFEMLTLSLYQKLNEERREILEEFRRTGRAYEV